MSNNFWLDWAILTVSLANTILLLWLGLTVLLNAERRTWGAWLAGTGLLLGGVFFVGHTAVFGSGSIFYRGINVWWQLGWFPVIALPYSWYLVMLWYGGYWEEDNTSLYDRQKFWLRVVSFLGLLLVGLFTVSSPIPQYNQYHFLDLMDTPQIGGLPLVALLYPVYIFLCITLALDALRRPGPSHRIMGDLARQRARPWLVSTSVMLLAVCFTVAWALIWVLMNANSPGLFLRSATMIGLFDLAISSQIGIAIILLGQAIVAYEVFTGKALPRRGFLRHWRRAIALALGYGVVVSLSLNLNLLPIYILLLTALIMTIFYALLSWRSYTERERYIDHLRPFVANQGFFSQLVTSSNRALSEPDMAGPFEALCKDVLGTKVAYLIALGPLAPLVGPPLSFPKKVDVQVGNLADLLKEFSGPEPVAKQIIPQNYQGASWAIPLWSERGLIGVLLLGDKRDGGLYTQEEIEIAQTSGERLIDTKASAEIGQRLMALQRQRMAESQLLDQRARRVLHDDVLQQLHTAMLKLVQEKSRPNGGTSEAIEMLADVHSIISDLLREMPTTSQPQIAKFGLVGTLQKLVSEEMGQSFDSVEWKIDHEAEREMQLLSPLTTEVLFYATREAIRNAARYAREDLVATPLHLVIRILWQDELIIQVEDDGVGVHTERNISAGSGQGLALHSTMMAVVGGELTVESEIGEFTRVSLNLPVE